MDNAIITRESVNALTNKELKKDLITMSNAVINGKKSSWTYAFALDKIVKGEEFKDDFKTITKLSQFIGTSKATVSQITNAVDFIKRANLVEYTDKHKPILDTIPCTVAIAYLFSTMTSEDFINFIIWLKEEKEIETPYNLTQAEARKLIKEFFTDEEAETEEAETEEAETEEAETEEKPSREDVINNIKKLIKEYNITESELF